VLGNELAQKFDEYFGNGTKGGRFWCLPKRMHFV
jgi:hypothetical protein